MIEERHDAGVSPEIDSHILQAGQIQAILANARRLSMTCPNMLQDLSFPVKRQNALVTPPRVNFGLRSGVIAEISHGDAIGVVLEFGVAAPELPTCVIPERVSDQDFVPAISVRIERIRKMPSLALPFPQQFQTIVEYPEIL